MTSTIPGARPNRAPIDRAIDLYRRAADASGERLAAIATDEQIDRLREDRHLQPVFAVCLREAASADGETISPHLSHGLKREWPRLGRFDVSVRVERRDVVGELKCGIGPAKLDACAWDMAKLAFVLHHGVGSAGLLVACTDQRTWEASSLGSELLDTGVWDMADIRERYAAGFRRWEGDGYKPNRVLRWARTTALHHAEPFDIAGEPWSIRLARVEPVSEEIMDWPPLRGG